MKPEHTFGIRFRIKEKYRQLIENECTLTAKALKEAYLGNHLIQKSKPTILKRTQFHGKIEGIS